MDEEDAMTNPAAVKPLRSDAVRTRKLLVTAASEAIAAHRPTGPARHAAASGLRRLSASCARVSYAREKWLGAECPARAGRGAPGRAGGVTCYLTGAAIESGVRPKPPDSNPQIQHAPAVSL